jgi:acylphosphatase
LISGLVQGVGFRYFTTSTAKKYPVTGYVRNLDTGDVEVEVEGPKEDVKEFLLEMKKGPGNSQIDSFQVEWKKSQDSYDSFFVRYK